MASIQSNHLDLKRGFYPKVAQKERISEWRNDDTQEGKKLRRPRPQLLKKTAPLRIGKSLNRATRNFRKVERAIGSTAHLLIEISGTSFTRDVSPLGSMRTFLSIRISQRTQNSRNTGAGLEKTECRERDFASTWRVAFGRNRKLQSVKRSSWKASIRVVS